MKSLKNQMVVTPCFFLPFLACCVVFTGLLSGGICGEKEAATTIRDKAKEKINFLKYRRIRRAAQTFCQCCFPEILSEN
ncbi:MAG: hypothetical protein KF734_03625 [Saprospiraceae bacterium]|nr:hypothetical protein [Saprospiraceae bacterium]